MMMIPLAYRAVSYLTVALLGALCGEGVIVRQMRSAVARRHTGALPNAYFIVHANECDGMFDFLSIFDRPDVASHVHFDGIYVIGDTRDSANVATVARAHDLHTTIRRASTPISFQRTALGYSNAVLVITDAHERVIIARAVPSSPSNYVAFAQLLTHPLL